MVTAAIRRRKKRELLKKKGFLYGQTDMPCLSVTKWTLDPRLKIEKKNLLDM